MRGKPDINKVERDKVKIFRGKSLSSDYVDRPAAECVAMVWELTQELWSIAGGEIAQRRLQRNVAAPKKQ